MNNSYFHNIFDNEFESLGLDLEIDINKYIKQSNRRFINCQFISNLLYYIEKSKKYVLNDESMKSLTQFIIESNENIFETLNKSIASNQVVKYFKNHYKDEYVSHEIHNPMNERCKICLVTKNDISKDKWFISFCNLMNYKFIKHKSENKYYLEPQVADKADDYVYGQNRGFCYKFVSYNKGKKYQETGIKGDSSELYDKRIYMFSAPKIPSQYELQIMLSFVKQRNERKESFKEPFDTLLLIDLNKLDIKNPLIPDRPKFYFDPSFQWPAVYTNDFIPKECIIKLVRI